jgi:predicted amidohydrolase YtcJ
MCPVSLAVVNARVWTGDARRPWADAIAVAGDRITAVGSSAQIRKMTDATARVIDAHGAMLTPGFIDSHIHFLAGGLGLSSVQLRDAKTPAELVARIQAFAAAAPPGSWITRGDWDHEQWGGELPRREWIDAATPEHPVFVTRLDGHMGLANSAALAAAGVTRATADVPGGTIVRDAHGAPTGILKDNAMALVADVIPAPSPAMQDRALDAAMHFVARQGVTSVHHMGTWDDLAVFERAHREGRLITRIAAAVPLASWERLRDTVSQRGRGDAWLRIGGLKAFADGSLGSRTAAFLDPYADAPHDRGLLVTAPDDLYRWSALADRAGLQVITHAIGDRAIRTVLDVYQRVEREHGAADRRFRVEHAQHIAPPDIPRFAALGVIASMQPYHAMDDGRWADAVIGPERRATTYAFRSLLDAHVPLAFGSDWFVAPPTPLDGVYAAVTRRTLDGKHPDGWVPAQKIGVEDALRAYTSGGAFASFQEHDTGTLEAGKLADFALIDRDITRIPPDEITRSSVIMTVVGGQVVYESCTAIAR